MCLRGDFTDYADFCGNPRPSWAVNVLVTALGEMVPFAVSFIIYYTLWRVALAIWGLLF